MKIKMQCFLLPILYKNTSTGTFSQNSELQGFDGRLEKVKCRDKNIKFHFNQYLQFPYTLNILPGACKNVLNLSLL